MKKQIKKIIFITLALVIIVIIALGYLSSYIGYYGYDKDKVRRFSNSVKESKKRKTFKKELCFLFDQNNIKDIDVYIEKGYRWGNSYKKTRNLDSNDTIFNTMPNLPFQIVVSTSNEQDDCRIAVVSKEDKDSEFHPYIPLSSLKLNDTIRLSLSLNHKFEGIIKIWDCNE